MANRVLLLITDLELGGTPTVVRELAIRLLRANPYAELEVACLSRWGPVADQLRDAGITVTALNAHGPADLFITLPRLIRLIRRKKFNTIFSFLMHANAMAAAASLRLGDLRWIQSIQTTQPNPKWHWPIQRLAQHAAGKVVVPSPSVARAAADWAGVPEEKIVVIPNAIDPAEWENVRSPIPLADPRPYPITFLGRLDPIKDVPTLIQAVRLLTFDDELQNRPGARRPGSKPLVHLHIYGEGNDRKRIEECIIANALQASVTLHGAIEHPQSALVGSGLLILPSVAEGFGLVLIEAMAAGVPVIGTDVPGIRDVVRDKLTGILVPVGDARAMANAICKIVTGDERDRFIRNAAADVRDRFTWNVVLKQYQAILGL